MNDRELCIHSVVSLTGFFRRNSNTEPDPELFKYLLESTRLALFSKIPLKEMYDIADECDEQDKEIVKLTEKMAKFIESNK